MVSGLVMVVGVVAVVAVAMVVAAVRSQTRDSRRAVRHKQSDRGNCLCSDSLVADTLYGMPPCQRLHDDNDIAVEHEHACHVDAGDT